MTNEINELKKALETSPDNKIIRNLIITKLEESKDNIALLEFLEKSVSVDPLDMQLRYKIAKAFFEAEKYENSFLTLEFILERDKTDYDSYMLFAKNLHALWQDEKAKEIYKKTIENKSSLKDSSFENDLWLKDEKDLNYNYEWLVPWEDLNKKDLELSTWNLEKISFDDVAWMSDLKEQIKMKIIYPLQNKDLFKAYDKKIGWWILLYWPPGCWKTFIARATAW